MTNIVQFTPLVASSVSQKLRVIRAELEPVAEAASFVLGWAKERSMQPLRAAEVA